ncbi:hypothetical protein OAN31_05910 [Pseudomonadales bacterium]|nr:hypothetical protein [Pseudomonadales bacterium]
MYQNIHLVGKDAFLQSRGFEPMNPGLISGHPDRYIAYERGFGEQYDKFAVATVLALTMPGIGSQIRNVPALLAGRLSIHRVGQLYGPTLLGLPSFGGMAISYIYDQLTESRGGRDAKPGTTVPPVGPGRRPRPPIKPSRPGKPGQTSKPFWSNGKPKCKKGFRYDFKRKLCVKIK